MAIYFLDTSALVKRYVYEEGTAWIRSICDPLAGHQIVIARITPVELIAALARRRRMQTLPAAQLRVLVGLAARHMQREYHPKSAFANIRHR